MHKFAKQIMECVKTKVEAMGIDNIEGPHLEELEKWTEIAKNIVCYDKDYKIVEAMEEAKEEEENETKYYTKRNRKMPMLDDMNYDYGPHMMPERMSMEMYNPNERIKDMERYYDGNRSGNGNSTNYGNNGSTRTGGMNMGNRSGRNGRMYFDGEQDMSKVEKARQAYMDAMEMHKGNTAEEKQTKVRELENFMTAFAEDMMQMAGMMSPEEKTMAKTKLTNMISKI